VNCASLDEVDLLIQQQAVQLDARARQDMSADAVLACLEDPELAEGAAQIRANDNRPRRHGHRFLGEAPVVNVVAQRRPGLAVAGGFKPPIAELFIVAVRP